MAKKKAIIAKVEKTEASKQIMVKEFLAREYQYEILRECDSSSPVYPLLRDENGTCKMESIGPLHGRSFVVGREGERYVVSKGNGLGYTQFDFLFSGELSGMGDDTWGMLLKHDALRDFDVGTDVAALGIKTNQMEYVLSIDKQVLLPNGHEIKPILLQYSVECPYRICDAPFMEMSAIKEQVERWDKLNCRHFHQKYLIAADVMVKNLRLMHDNKILHNAIHEQNYTWALELLDFELGRSPRHPYEKSDYERHVESLFHREAFQTYVIINYIAWALKEDIDYSVIDGIFANYGYDLSQYRVTINKNL